ncbi:MAG TPA: adenylate/guanylate cyclase domain-containing protein [Verrucomicrobiae bacterium]|nr:adenylate/guanylate cyclase domain-containing protein [Verrucomicrobiae bacterium]
MPRIKSGRAEQSRALRLAGLCLVVTLAVLALDFLAPAWLRSPFTDADNYVGDLFARHGRYTPANTNLVLIGIDRPSYDDVFITDEDKKDPVLAALRERFPWSRKVWAAAITRLADAGVKVIAVDLVFAADADGDDELRAALDKYKDQVVIGANYTLDETDRGEPGKLTTPNTKLIPDLPNQPAALDSRIGFINIWLDPDDVFRRSRFRATNHELFDVVNTAPDTVLNSFDAMALAKFGAANKIPAIGTRQKIRFTGPPGTWPVIPLGDVLTPKIWEKNFANGKFFAGKLVLIGPTANIFQDTHRTPFRDEMPGPEIHLQIINAALHGEFVEELPPLATGALVALAGLIGAVLCQLMTAPVKRLLLICVIGGGFFLAAFFCFDLPGILSPVIDPLLALFTIGIFALIYDFVVERLERMKLRHTMGLYFSPRVLDAVLSDPGSMQPRRAEVVLLLTDLRNSTPLAEMLGPKGMFELLNKVFEAQTGAIMSEEGNLEHFLGDQFLSYWGAPQKQPDAAGRAARAAMKLIRAMEDLRTTLPPEVEKIFGYGVALHSGSVLVGNKGSALRLDYGLVGDTVNEAARVESLTKYYGVKLLVTRDTFAQFNPQGARRLLDRVIVKGKSEAVELFECENPCTPKDYALICERYKAAYDEYFFGRFAEAHEQFEKLIADFSDGPSKTLAARCAELSAHSPAKWTGIWKMDAK